MIGVSARIQAEGGKVATDNVSLHRQRAQASPNLGSPSLSRDAEQSGYDYMTARLSSVRPPSHCTLV